MIIKQTNKWCLNIRDSYSLDNGQELIKTHTIMIPPTDGNRTDIYTECGKYYFDKTKEQFLQRMTKDEYLDKSMPGIEPEERENVLKNITWTPIKTTERIALIIEIESGNITLKGK